MVASAVLYFFLAFGSGGGRLVAGCFLFFEAGNGRAGKDGKMLGTAPCARATLLGTSSRIFPPSSAKYLFFKTMSSVKCLLHTASLEPIARFLGGIARAQASRSLGSDGALNKLTFSLQLG
uniref:Putative secreted protein n=1 Tax=Ixodes ricinus TaxID=34613 RepID=A0A6B0UND8_IXORI